MSSRKNYLILFLSLTTVAGAIMVWQQHQELVELRVAATKVDQLAKSPKHVPSMISAGPDVAANAAASDEAPLPAPSAVDAETAASGPRPARGEGPGANYRAMMDRPEIQRLMAVQQKSALDSRYAALFRSLSLSPDQLERFKDLLVEKRTAAGDVRSAAREQGLNARSDPAAFAKLVSDAQADIDETIRATLGDSGYAQYQNYEKTFPQRNTVNQLEQRLSYSSTPLTTQQSEQIVSILASTAQAGRNNIAGGANGPAAFQARNAETRITDATINQALGVLAAPQIDALRQLQQEQEAQAALNAAMRNRFREDAAAPVPGVGTSAYGPVPVPRPNPSSPGP